MYRAQNWAVYHKRHSELLTWTYHTFQSSFGIPQIVRPCSKPLCFDFQWDPQALSRLCFSSNRVNRSRSRASNTSLCTRRALLKCFSDITRSTDPLEQIPDSMSISENPLPFIIYLTVPNNEQIVWNSPIRTVILLNCSEYCQIEA